MYFYVNKVVMVSSKELIRLIRSIKNGNNCPSKTHFSTKRHRVFSCLENLKLRSSPRYGQRVNYRRSDSPTLLFCFL